MNEHDAAITVTEATMQEWAMLAFHAARAPQRVRVATLAVPAAADERCVAGARSGFWIALAGATLALAWLLL